MPDRPADASTLADFVRVARRRKWIIIQAVILVPLVAVVHAMRKPNIYESSAQVLLNRQSVSSIIGSPTPDIYASQDPTRYSSTQTFLARSPDVARHVVADVKIPSLDVGGFLGSSSVSAAANADVLTFTVVSTVPVYAQREANAYAAEFVKYRSSLDTQAINDAIAQLNDRIVSLQQQGQGGTSYVRSLSDREQQLLTEKELQKQNTVISRPAGPGFKISPRPKRDGILGLALGLALGLGLAFLRDTFDTRLRSAEEIGERLGLPLLGRLPEPPRNLRVNFGLVMLEEPYTAQGETFRMLRTNIELTNLDRHARSIMITSALEAEGKTTTAANLAVALARAGRHAVLVDLDLRRPAIDRYFDLRGRPGLTDVVLGDVTLDEALATIALPDFQGSGHLEVLPSGPTPPDPGEFAATSMLAALLEDLMGRADVVVLDTPPVLHAAEALALSTHIDAMAVVVRLNVARRPTVSELKRMLETTPCAKLGFILTAADAEPNYASHGYSPRAYAYADDGEAVQ